MTRPYILLALTPLALLNATGVGAGEHKAPPTFYSTVPLTAADKKHLLNDDFTVVKTVREMPAPIQKLLIPDTKDPLKGMADAGQDFERTDTVSGKLPMRRLVLAAVNLQYCLVYFEQGGIGYGQRVILFRLQDKHAAARWDAWRGGHFLSSEKGLMTFSELRAAVKASKRHPASANSSYPAIVSRRNSA